MLLPCMASPLTEQWRTNSYSNMILSLKRDQFRSRLYRKAKTHTLAHNFGPCPPMTNFWVQGHQNVVGSLFAGVSKVKIHITNVFVDDQAQALEFYTEKLGFIVKHDVPMGTHRWLTVVSPEHQDGTELLLEPSDHPAVGPYKSALVADGIPAASFQVDDLDTTFTRLNDLGVVFTQAPMDAGPVRMAVLDDTCGNLIQLVEITGNMET